jgi:hypothetical protein
MGPVDYPSWLANPVLAEKPDGSWRMCIDYTSLNKVYPKDEYPMSRIYQIVGMLPRAPGGLRFLFIAINTFTKWMEVMPVLNITQDAAVKFLQSIIYRFNVPR